LRTLRPSGVSTTPISPRVKLSLIIALLAGLIFNGGLALLIEFLADRLPDVDDLEALTGKPVLATVPPLSFRSANMDRLQQRLAEASHDPEPEIVRQAARSQPRRTSG
jgi:hypothetical protein